MLLSLTSLETSSVVSLTSSCTNLVISLASLPINFLGSLTSLGTNVVVSLTSLRIKVVKSHLMMYGSLLGPYLDKGIRFCSWYWFMFQRCHNDEL